MTFFSSWFDKGAGQRQEINKSAGPLPNVTDTLNQGKKCAGQQNKASNAPKHPKRAKRGIR